MLGDDPGSTGLTGPAPAGEPLAPDDPIDLLTPSALADPHTVFHRLRAAGPVVWSARHHAWVVTTHAEVSSAFRDPRLSSDRLTPLERRLDPARRAVLGPTFDLLRGWMVFHDPPDHERLRDPVRTAFTPRSVEALRPRVRALVHALCDDLAEPPAPADLVRRLAFPLPATVIAELLGVPAADREQFKTWSAQLGAVVFGASGRPDQAELAAAGTARFAEYFRALVAEHEQRPADDLTSALIASRDQADGGLDAQELVGALTLLLFGGHETTTNLISSSVLLLAADPERWAWLAAHPGAIPGAVEELHRLEPPSKLMVRVVAQDHQRGGQQLLAGQTVFLAIAAANRDPAVFADPDRLDLTRREAVRHLGFGYGLHHCLGAPLARLEAQEALAALLARFPRLRLAEGEPQWSAVILGRSLRALPVLPHG